MCALPRPASFDWYKVCEIHTGYYWWPSIFVAEYIPLRNWIGICLSSLLVMDIWAVFQFGLLQAKLSITFLNLSLCRHMFLFLSDPCPRVELPHCIVSYNQRLQNCFPKCGTIYAPTISVWEFWLLHLLPDICRSFAFWSCYRVWSLISLFLMSV